MLIDCWASYLPGITQDAAPAPKRRTAAVKPVYNEESSVSEDSRPKPASQVLGSRSDTSNVPAKASKPAKEPTAKKTLPSTIMEESEDDAPKRTHGASTKASAGDENEAIKAPTAEKKKKRKLGALLGATTFTWDQTLVSRAVSRADWFIADGARTCRIPMDQFQRPCLL